MTLEPHVPSSDSIRPLWMKLFDGAELVAQGLLIFQRDLSGLPAAADAEAGGTEAMRRIADSLADHDPAMQPLTHAVAAQVIRQALNQHAGDRDAAAEYLGLSRQTLDQRIDELNIR